MTQPGESLSVQKPVLKKFHVLINGMAGFTVEVEHEGDILFLLNQSASKGQRVAGSDPATWIVNYNAISTAQIEVA